MAVTDSNFILNGLVLTEPVLKEPGVVLRPVFLYDFDPEAGGLVTGFSIWLKGPSGHCVRREVF